MSFIDLHIHSNFSSDGEWSVRQIVQGVARARMAAFSVSDHDTVAALPEAERLTAETSAEWIPNVEISTRFRGTEFHLLAPLVDWQSKTLKALLDRAQELRKQQTKHRIELLQQQGFNIEFEEVAEAVGDVAITGPAIAQVLLGKAGAKSDHRLRQFFELDRVSPEVGFYKAQFLPGQRAYAPKQELDLLAAIDTVRVCRGVPVLAHPGLKTRAVDDELVGTLADNGLEGMEAFSSYHDDKDSRRFSRLAEKYGLVVTAGSDFHGKLKPAVSFGCVRDLDYEAVDSLKKRQERM